MTRAAIVGLLWRCLGFRDRPPTVQDAVDALRVMTDTLRARNITP